MMTPAPGTLLIAEPFLKDPNFSRTVVFICDHHEQGSFGFVLNRAYNHTLDELMNDMGDLKIPVFLWWTRTDGYYSFSSPVSRPDHRKL
jgi:putative transcriptional regulator